MTVRGVVRFGVTGWCVSALGALGHTLPTETLSHPSPYEDALPSIPAPDRQGPTVDVDRIIAQNLFNPSRQPTEAPMPSSFGLAVIGILMAPRPSAVIRGIRGYEESQILAPGDSLGNVLVVSVAAEGVIARVDGDTLSLPFGRNQQ